MKFLSPTGLFALLLLLAAPAHAQNTSDLVQWGVAGDEATGGYVDAVLIPATTGTAGVRFYDINEQGYDLVVVTKGLVQDGADVLPWNGDRGWSFEGGTASKAGQSIAYSTVEFHFYQTGTNIPFGVTGVNFTFEDAEVGERFRAFNVWDAAGTKDPLDITDDETFYFSSGAPNIHQSDSSFDSGSPYQGGTQEGKEIGVDLSARAISGFTFQAGRYSSSYGGVIMTGLGNLVPTGQLLIQTGNDLNITGGPTFLTTGSNALLSTSDLTAGLQNSDASISTGAGIVQNIAVNENIIGTAGHGLTMTASRNIVSATSEVSTASNYVNGGNINLTASNSVYLSVTDSSSVAGTGGAINISAGNLIFIEGGLDSFSNNTTSQGGNITLNAGNDVVADVIRTSGGGDPALYGVGGTLAVTGSNSVSIGTIYDDSGFGNNTVATVTSPSILIGGTGTAASDIEGTLYIEKPTAASGASAAIDQDITGTGSLVMDTGAGAVTLGANLSLTGETDVISGSLYMQGYSLENSAVVLDGSSVLVPGVTTQDGVVNIDSLTVGTQATVETNLSSETVFDDVVVAATANLAGIFKLDVAPGFTPQIGDVFDVMDCATLTGTYGSYEGVRLADCVLEPVFTGSNMTLVASAIPTGAAEDLQNVPAGGLGVPAGGDYDGLTATLPTASGFVATATLLDGVASQDTTVTMALAATGIENMQIQGSLGVTLLNLAGTGNDKVVVQLDYNEAEALAAAGDERNLYLASSADGSTPFANAVLANTDLPGEPNNPTFINGPYDPDADFQLGYYGVDTINNRVWAVVDYEAYFGIGATSVPAAPTGPAAATETVSGVLAESATLNGLINPNGYATTGIFEWGTDPALSGSTTLSPAATTGMAAVITPMTYVATGLIPATKYYYRADAVTISGTQYGGILSFTTPQSAVNLWRYSYFGTYANTGSAADSANPAGDGIVNLIKYATGLSPLVAYMSSPETLGQVTVAGQTYLTLTFPRITDPALTYTVQGSNSANGPWTTIWTSTGSSNTAGNVTVQDTVPISAQPGRFLRLQVSD